MLSMIREFILVFQWFHAFLIQHWGGNRPPLPLFAGATAFYKEPLYKNHACRRPKNLRNLYY